MCLVCVYLFVYVLVCLFVSVLCVFVSVCLFVPVFVLFRFCVCKIRDDKPTINKQTNRKQTKPTQT